MQTFMVECYWPGDIDGTAAQGVSRVARLAAAASHGHAAGTALSAAR